MAGFTFAPYVRVKTNLDRDYFENSNNFKVIEWRGRSARFHRYALYYPRVSNAMENIDNLPDGYTAESWKPVPYIYVGGNRAVFASIYDEGVFTCDSCPTVRRHKLNWPEDAYFQIAYRGHLLWAYNREFAVSLLSYLESETRMKTMVSTRGVRATRPFLNSVPTVFQTAKARPVVVRALKQKLGRRIA